MQMQLRMDMLATSDGVGLFNEQTVPDVLYDVKAHGAVVTARALDIGMEVWN